jgi:hypothetical protein
MSKYRIKSEKIGEGMYNHELINRYNGSLRDEVVIENGQTVKEFLQNYGISIVPFIRKNKIKSIETKIEVVKE